MSDEDMIRRGDAKRAFETLFRTKSGYSGMGCNGYLTLTDATAQILDYIPAVQVTVKPEEAALEEQIEKLRNLCDCDCDDEDCVKCAHYPAILEQKKDELARIRSALTVQQSPDVAALVDAEGHWGDFIKSGIIEADKAMRKYPQPNYVISKIAEESGEVVKAAIHAAEGRETLENVRAEMRQLIAMLYRLWIEGDQVHGLPPVSAAIASMKGGVA